MSLQIRAWKTFQAGAIGNILTTRASVNLNRARRGLEPLPMERPYTMDKVLVARVFDRNFAEFAEKVGTRQAETFWIRTLQFAADSHGLTGLIEVDRNDFGPVVLTRRTPYVDKVSAGIGRKVWDALVASGMAVHIEDRTGTPYSTAGSTVNRSAWTMPSPSPSPSSSGGKSGSRSKAGAGRAKAAPAAVGDLLGAALDGLVGRGLPERDPTDDELREQLEAARRSAATNGHHPEEPA